MTERGLLRVGLYAILAVSLAHVLLMRYFMITFGLFGGQMFNRFGQMGMPDDGGMIGWCLRITTLMLGPGASETSLLLAAICMVGLLASAKQRRSSPRPLPRAAAKPITEPTPISLKPKPPERHPLDPDPDDPPYENTWARPSKT